MLIKHLWLTVPEIDALSPSTEQAHPRGDQHGYGRKVWPTIPSFDARIIGCCTLGYLWRLLLARSLARTWVLAARPHIQVRFMVREAFDRGSQLQIPAMLPEPTSRFASSRGSSRSCRSPGGSPPSEMTQKGDGYPLPRAGKHLIHWERYLRGWK